MALGEFYGFCLLAFDEILRNLNKLSNSMLQIKEAHRNGHESAQSHLLVINMKTQVSLNNKLGPLCHSTFLSLNQH